MIDYFGSNFFVTWEFNQLTERIFRATYTKARTNVTVYVDELDLIQVSIVYTDEIGAVMSDLSVQFTGSQRRSAALAFLYSAMIRL